MLRRPLRRTHDETGGPTQVGARHAVLLRSEHSKPVGAAPLWWPCWLRRLRASARGTPTMRCF